MDEELQALLRRRFRHASTEGIAHLIERTPTCLIISEIAQELGRLGLCESEHVRAMERGKLDFVALKARDDDQTIVIGMVHRSPLTVSHAQRRWWTATGAHLAAGFRLRRALCRRAGPSGAVPTVEGALERGEAPASRWGGQSWLRNAVVALDRKSAGRDGLELWRPLVDGRWTLVDRFGADGKHFVVALVVSVTGCADSALRERERRVAHLAATGMTNVEIGRALGLCRSAVSRALTQAMVRLGVGDRAVLPLVFDGAARAHEMEVGGVELRIGVHDIFLPESLTAAESEVALLAAGGLSDAAIADRRGTSARTVANLMRSIYRKRGLSNRTELIRDMVDADSALTGGVGRS